MKRLATLALLFALPAFAPQLDYSDWHVSRNVIGAWQDFFAKELLKSSTNNYAVGMALTSNMEMQANTRQSQLRYFDRKAHRMLYECEQINLLTNITMNSNFVFTLNRWMTNLPSGPE
jgi:hypothetical protein